MTQSDTPLESTSTADNDTWFLRIDDLRVRGPITLTTLREWAETGALTPDEAVSPDGRDWRPAHTLPALAMEWIADLGDGQTYGPFNLMAARHLTARGVLKSDSVLRRASPPPAETATAPASPPPNAVMGRVSDLEHELQALRRQLASVQRGQDLQRQRPSSRAITIVPARPRAAAEQLRDEIRQREAQLNRLTRGQPAEGTWQHQPSDETPAAGLMRAPATPTAGTLAALHDGGYVVWRPEDVRELARSRRFRASTLRWNVINSTLVIGSGVTVGALGFILETEPVHYTGLVLSVLGIAYFCVVMLMLLLRKAMTWVAISVTRAEEQSAVDHQHPVRGALSITVYWLNRTFGPRTNDDANA